MSSEAEASGLREGISNSSEVQGLKGETSDKTRAQEHVVTKNECQGPKEKKEVETDPKDLREKSLKDEAEEAPPPNFLLTKPIEAGGVVSDTKKGSSGNKRCTERVKKQKNTKKGQKAKVRAEVSEMQDFMV